ncbi:hypothetical protein INT45_010835 [Circinella minor]|uniref:Transketolase-like pyrimidine-binding domain-containing protein n=1 Tax=Circinella minor TaxID=1195481 RepID=A0A8H7VJ86_9FUNG|nr:hypothetical protein INT45_010835 [Circinella minor]
MVNVVTDLDDQNTTPKAAKLSLLTFAANLGPYKAKVAEDVADMLVKIPMTPVWVSSTFSQDTTKKVVLRWSNKEDTLTPDIRPDAIVSPLVQRAFGPSLGFGEIKLGGDQITNHPLCLDTLKLASASERRWWYHAVESWTKPQLSIKQKKRIHELLTKSETFDHFLAKKFPNIKRYGLEGAESMMVALDRLFELSAQAGVQGVLIGMPHCGRLNLLCDLLEYPHATVTARYNDAPRQTKSDIILDLICYRRRGHNELDESAFTQPLMYNNIRLHNSVPKQYEQKLIEDNVFESSESVAAVRESQYELLDSELKKANDSGSVECPSSYHLKGDWKGIQHVKTRPLPEEEPDTGVEKDILDLVGKQSVTAPDADNIKLHPRLEKYHIADIDWATAEALSFGTLLKEEHDVRISGQDVGCGTFSQRHAMFVDQNTEKAVIPLNHGLGDGQGFVEVANSPLSEYAVLGFEYGMSIESPNRLVIWEAQFGDFFNGAQIAIDTFISSSEAKWLRQTGLVMLLPHGQDGAGPEHSSSHVERFLQMSNEPIDIEKCYDIAPNWSVIHRPYRKPLIVISPKGLLKSPAAVSTLDEMAPGMQFKPVLDDPVATQAPNKIEKVVFVSGKLYYDLVKERASKSLDDRIALVRIEEMSPFPRNELENVIDQYSYARDFVWCQEEPENAGAYTFMAPRIAQLIPRNEKLQYVGREALAAPATGISSQYRAEQTQLIQDALTL